MDLEVSQSDSGVFSGFERHPRISFPSFGRPDNLSSRTASTLELNRPDPQCLATSIPNPSATTRSTDTFRLSLLSVCPLVKSLSRTSSTIPGSSGCAIFTSSRPPTGSSRPQSTCVSSISWEPCTLPLARSTSGTTPSRNPARTHPQRPMSRASFAWLPCFTTLAMARSVTSSTITTSPSTA